MPHCDPDVLALRALGEGAGSSADDDHLAQCARCQSELDQLRAVVSTSRAAGDTSAAPLESPPPAVWDRVVAEVGLGTPVAVVGPEPSRPVVGGHRGRRPDARRRRTTVLLSAAAAILGALVGVLGTLLVSGLAEEEGTGRSVEASATLAPLPEGPPGGSGQARVVPAEDGRRLEVSVSGFEPEPGRYYEVWLLDGAGERLYSLGALDSDLTGSFRVPDDVDLAEFLVVDVSAEPYDGDPGHSSVSVSRGTLSV